MTRKGRGFNLSSVSWWTVESVQLSQHAEGKASFPTDFSFRTVLLVIHLLPLLQLPRCLQAGSHFLRRTRILPSSEGVHTHSATHHPVPRGGLLSRMEDPRALSPLFWDRILLSPTGRFCVLVCASLFSVLLIKWNRMKWKTQAYTQAAAGNILVS